MKNRMADIIQLLGEYFTGEMKETRSEELRQWVEEKEENKIFFERLCKDGSFREHWQLREKIDFEKAIRNFDKRTGKRSLNLTLKKSWKYVAAAVIILLIGGGLLTLLQPTSVPENYARENILPGCSKAVLVLANGQEVSLTQQDSICVDLGQGTQAVSRNDRLVYTGEIIKDLEYNELKVPRGGEYQLVLSDGTTVHLNSSSSIKYPVTFGKDKREVMLTGEAFFEVAKDSERVFTVRCKDYEVKVLGTTFNISAYEDDETSTTTLVEGHVQIRHQNREIDLLPGHMATIKAGEMSVDEVEVDHLIAWTKDYFSFKEEPLEQILKKMARWYNVDFVYMLPEIRHYHFSGHIPRYVGIISVLQIMEQAAPVHFQQEGRQVKIYKTFE